MFRNEPIHLCGRHSHPWSPNLIDPPVLLRPPFDDAHDDPLVAVGPTYISRPDRALSEAFFHAISRCTYYVPLLAARQKRNALSFRCSLSVWAATARRRWMEVSYSIAPLLINPYSFLSFLSNPSFSLSLSLSLFGSFFAPFPSTIVSP